MTDEVTDEELDKEIEEAIKLQEHAHAVLMEAIQNRDLIRSVMRAPDPEAEMTVRSPEHASNLQRGERPS